jgi:hypothetical protein
MNATKSVVGVLVMTGSLFVGGGFNAENVDPDADGSRYAWSENAGWINAEPSGNGGPGLQVSDFAITGWMWGENLGWISLSCQNTGSCGTADYGIANDGHGVLTGYAWSENAGWIDFAPSTGGATVDVATGELGGFVWSENLGWIGLSCSDTGSCGTTDYGIKTGWCQSTASPPAATPEIAASKNGVDIQLDWGPVAGAGWYEVVRGDLSDLRSGSGDFAAATGACAADDDDATTVVLVGDPAPGEGIWFAVRAVNCRGKGSYDSTGSGQVAPRDAGITASGNDCS